MFLVANIWHFDVKTNGIGEKYLLIIDEGLLMS